MPSPLDPPTFWYKYLHNQNNFQSFRSRRNPESEIVSELLELLVSELLVSESEVELSSVS